MLTKREKILLQVLIVLVLLALTVSFLLTPAMKSLVIDQADLETVTAELKRVEAIYNYAGLDERLEEEKKIADANYQYFYSVLNSFTIDGIVNNLLQKNNLSINSLHITPYEDAYFDFKLPEEDIEYGDGAAAERDYPKVLVKSTITVNVNGGYTDVLRFMDDLNQTSKCLRVNWMNVSEFSGLLGETYEKSAEFKIYVYGINLEPITGQAYYDLIGADQAEE